MADFKQILLTQNPKYKRLQSIQSTISTQSKESVFKTKTKRFVLNSFDTMISLIVISPLVIGNWRGSWVLMDLHSEYFPPYESWLFCCGLHIGFMLLQWIFRDCSKQQRKKYQRNLFFQVWRRIYIALFAESIIMMWRGGWLVYDGWFGITMVDAMRAGCYDGFKSANETLVGCENVTVYGAPNIAAYAGTMGEFNPCPCATNDLVIWITLLIMVAMLGMLRSIRNNLAVPFIIAVDSETSSFVFPTRFRTEMVQKTSLYILDCLFSVLVVGTLVVFVWRGAWVLLDLYLFPENGTWSAWGSLVLGYMSVAIAFLMQPAMKWLCDRLGGTMRLVVTDAFLLFAALGTVNVWRGIWNLLNIYFLPDDMDLSCWITHWVSLILLILLGCSNSLLVRGVYIDAEEPAGKCVLFPCYYLRQIFQHERAQKIFFGSAGATNYALDDIDTIKRELEIGDKLAHYVVGGGVANMAMENETVKEQRKLSEQLQKEQLEGVKVIGNSVDSNHV